MASTVPCRLGHPRGPRHDCQAQWGGGAYGGKKRRIQFLCSSPSLKFREENVDLKISLWLALFRPFNFLLLSMNNETEQFPVSQPPLSAAGEFGFKLPKRNI